MMKTPVLDPLSPKPSPCQVTIDKLVSGGIGLARHDAQVVMVKGGLPGETLLIQMGEKHRGVLYGDLVEVLVPSKDRMAPPCPLFHQCGGCQLQHLNYTQQLLQKEAILRDTLLRVGKFPNPEIRKMIPSFADLGYRHSARFAIFQRHKKFQVGFFKEGTRKALPVEDCLLIPKPLRTVMREVASRLETQAALPVFLQSVEARWSTLSETALLIFRGMYQRSDQAKRLLDQFDGIPHVMGRIVELAPSSRKGSSKVSRCVEGNEYLMERFGDLTFRIGARSFMQANWPVYEAIGRHMANWLGALSGQRVLELYAGIGALGVSVAKQGALSTLVEVNPYALTDARRSASLNHVGRCRFRAASVENFLPSVHLTDYDVVLVDPPRTGLTPMVLAELVRIRIPRLLYLSCDAATVARDLSRLTSEGYHIVQIQPFDMFPQTSHIETLVELAFD